VERCRDAQSVSGSLFELYVKVLENLCAASPDIDALRLAEAHLDVDAYSLDAAGADVDMAWTCVAEKISAYTPLEHAAVVPYIRRMGFHVKFWLVQNTDPPEPDEVVNNCYVSAFLPGDLGRLQQCEMETWACGHPVRLTASTMLRWHILPARPACVTRCLAVARCIPRLLGWLRAARIALAHPSRVDMEKLLEEMCVEMENR
jgi:hypothetical protein